MIEYVLPFNTGTSKEPMFTFLDPISRGITTGRIFIKGTIKDDIVEDAYNKFLFFKDNNFPEIYIFIDSNGGDGDATTQFINLIKFSNMIVNTVCIGEAKSAGATILMSGTHGHRFAMPDTEIMIHHGSLCNLPPVGVSDLHYYAKDLTEFEDKMFKHMSKVTGKTVAFIKKTIKDGDHKMTPLQAKRFGVIDHVATAADFKKF
jgi:ATP-dependent Clp protease protease subunit